MLGALHVVLFVATLPAFGEPAPLTELDSGSITPALIGSNGRRAVFATVDGAWMTDGTPGGTRRIGQSAQLFGQSILASGGGFVVIDRSGGSWTPPAGVEGVSDSLLVGRDGCSAFTVNEDRARRELPEAGCVEQITFGPWGALLRNDHGGFTLQKGERGPYLLPAFQGGDFRCGKTRCWYVSPHPVSGKPITKILSLDTGEVTNVPVTFDEPNIELRGATDSLVVVKETDAALFFSYYSYVLPSGQKEQFYFGRTIHPPRFSFTDDDLILPAQDGLSFVNEGGKTGLPSPCGPAEVFEALGDRVNVWSGGPGDWTLCSGTRATGLSVLFTGDRTGNSPPMPEGTEDLMAFNGRDSTDGPTRFLVTDGEAKLELPELRGTGFARVRAGYVIAGGKQASDFTVDPQLWILPSGCGCSGGQAELVLLSVLLLRRRSRLSSAPSRRGTARFLRWSISRRAPHA